MYIGGRKNVELFGNLFSALRIYIDYSRIISNRFIGAILSLLKSLAYTLRERSVETESYDFFSAFHVAEPDEMARPAERKSARVKEHGTRLLMAIIEEPHLSEFMEMSSCRLLCAVCAVSWSAGLRFVTNSHSSLACWFFLLLLLWSNIHSKYPNTREFLKQLF